MQTAAQTELSGAHCQNVAVEQAGAAFHHADGVQNRVRRFHRLEDAEGEGDKQFAQRLRAPENK